MPMLPSSPSRRSPPPATEARRPPGRLDRQAASPLRSAWPRTIGGYARTLPTASLQPYGRMQCQVIRAVKRDDRLPVACSAGDRDRARDSPSVGSILRCDAHRRVRHSSSQWTSASRTSLVPLGSDTVGEARVPADGTFDDVSLPATRYGCHVRPAPLQRHSRRANILST